MSKFVCSVVVVLVVIAVQMQEGNALKCWRCSSDSSGSEFCNDPFDPTLIQSEQQRRWAYIDCVAPSIPAAYSGQLQKAVCKKIKQTVNDHARVTRSCVFVDYNTPQNFCERETYPVDAFCETCSFDGCNGAGTFVPVALLTIASVVVAKILAF